MAHSIAKGLPSCRSSLVPGERAARYTIVEDLLTKITVNLEERHGNVKGPSQTGVQPITDRSATGERVSKRVASGVLLRSRDCSCWEVGST